MVEIKGDLKVWDKPLQDELYHLIFQYFSWKELLRCVEPVCKKWRKLSSQESIGWSQLNFRGLSSLEVGDILIKLGYNRLKRIKTFDNYDDQSKEESGALPGDYAPMFSLVFRNLEHLGLLTNNIVRFLDAISSKDKIKSLKLAQTGWLHRKLSYNYSYYDEQGGGTCYGEDKEDEEEKKVYKNAQLECLPEFKNCCSLEIYSIKIDLDDLASLESLTKLTLNTCYRLDFDNSNALFDRLEHLVLDDSGPHFLPSMANLTHLEIVTDYSSDFKYDTEVIEKDDKLFCFPKLTHLKLGDRACVGDIIIRKNYLTITHLELNRVDIDYSLLQNLHYLKLVESDIISSSTVEELILEYCYRIDPHTDFLNVKRLTLGYSMNNSIVNLNCPNVETVELNNLYLTLKFDKIIKEKFDKVEIIYK